ncbi:MAG: hypothetical protein EBX19_08920, partial [Actinobacteria bacterium]|nr:hypothetical protein [Actinomycetota bacterium]
SDWRFNAWGGKCRPYDRDDAIPGRIARALSLRRFHRDMVLEGGSIDGNGRGLLLTSEQCLLNPNRNPDLSRAEIERAEGVIIAEYLPKQLSQSEVKELIEAAIKETGANSPAQMGLVMKNLQPKIAGKADGALVSSLVKAALAGGK